MCIQPFLSLHFGNATQRAVKAFQTHFGLSVDGIIGSVAWNRIVAEYNKIT